MSRLPALTAAAVLGCLAGCAPPPAPAYVQAPSPPGPPPQVVVSYPPLPAPRVEVIPPPPRERVVWQPGHWHWNGHAYDWIGGRYVARTVGATRWQPGHWAPRPGGYGWVPGHWV